MSAAHPLLRSVFPIPPMNVQPLASRLQATCDAQAAIIKRMQPPRTPIGQIEYVYRVGMLELVCHLEYEEAEKGLGISPDLAADTTLTAAYANGMDVSEYLDADVIKLIETKAAASLEE